MSAEIYRLKMKQTLLGIECSKFNFLQKGGKETGIYANQSDASDSGIAKMTNAIHRMMKINLNILLIKEKIKLK